MRKEFLKVINGTKTENGMELLRNFSLTIYKGSITFITGGSVLEMNGIEALLSGKEDFDSGDIYFEEKRISRKGTLRFLKESIMTASAEQQFVENISIVDNFFICSEKHQPFFARDKQNRKILTQLLSKFSVEVDLDLPISLLTILQRYQIFLLKVFYHGTKAVLLDKRKMPISSEEFSKLFTLLQQLKSRGMTILILDYGKDILWPCIDTFVMIKDASTILMTDACRFTEEKQQILFRESRKNVPQRQDQIKKAPEVLRLASLTGTHLQKIDLTLHRGEIAVIHYENSESQRELCRILDGEEIPAQGRIFIHGRETVLTTREKRVKEGIQWIREFGSQGYLFHNLTAWGNYCLPKGLQFKQLWKNSRYRAHLKAALNTLAGRDIASLREDELLPVEIVRVKYGAQLLLRPPVLICLNPFSSADRFLKKEVGILLTELSEQGTAVLLFSKLLEIKELRQYTKYKLTNNGELYLLNEENLM